MRSGTTLLASLIDSHPEINIVSDRMTFYWKYLFSKNKEISTLHEVKIFVQEILPSIVHLNDDNLSKYFESEKFYDDILRNKIDYYSVYLVLMAKLYYADLDGKVIGSKATHRWGVYDDYLKYFDKPKVIHIIRNPFDTYYSHKSRMNQFYTNPSVIKKYYNDIKLRTGLLFIDRKYYLAGYNSFNNFIYQNPMSIINEWSIGTNKAFNFRDDKRVLILRYEDLVTHLTGTMKNIFSHLEVNYDETFKNMKSLKNSLGNEFIANSSFKDKQIDYISRNSIGKSLQKLSNEEIAEIKDISMPFLKKLYPEMI